MLPTPRRKPMTPNQLILLDALLPRGKDQALSVTELRRAYEFDFWTELSDRSMRKMLETLVNRHHVCVCTGPYPDSVFVAQTPEEVYEAQAALRKVAMAYLRRARNLRIAGEHLSYPSRLV
jgi:hypothetical protein